MIHSDAHWKNLLFSCRREEFEKLLADYQAETDTFQEREVPRNLDEIKKVVVQLDQLSESLEKSKDKAMVSFGGTVD